MVRTVVDDNDHTIIEIIHLINEIELRMLYPSRDQIVNKEIEIMKEELKEDYPGFNINYAYPCREYMPSDEAYDNALYKMESTVYGRYLRVILRAVRWK